MKRAMQYIVKAMPERGAYVADLKQQIPDLQIVLDRKRDAMDTFARSLEAAGGDAAIHLEDDIVLTSNFLEKASRAVAERPDVVIQFFSMRKADLSVGSRWDRNFLMNQCFYAPPGYSALIREYYDTWRTPENLAAHRAPTDVVMRDFFKSRREDYWIHVPSLVDHRIGKSVIDPRRSSKRQSLSFAL